jgi:predicted peptidase
LQEGAFMMTRRDAIRLVGSMPFAAWTVSAQNASAPALAPGEATSPQRRALIDAFSARLPGIASQFDKRVHTGPWAMPYRLFRPSGGARAPLVLYLHGSGGLGDDNEKQLGLGNVFGTHLWALPENQARFPCYVVAPQTDRGWAKYQEAADGGPARVVPGFGDGARLALEIVRALGREFAIDERRIYLTGQSMGGAGVWNLLAHEPRRFAAAAICCGSATPDDVTRAVRTPIWNFHGEADQSVPVAISRGRIAALRQAGGHPVSTEYAGVDHNVWEWAYTEPALPEWLFAQHRAG